MSKRSVGWETGASFASVFYPYALLMAKFLTMLIVAFWISAIALISVQNATPVTLRFLFLQSVEIPVGLVLAFSAALGMIATATVLPLWRSSSRDEY